MRLMCVVQAGPQQAAGVVGYPQFPFLNQFDADAAATIVTFCDAAIDHERYKYQFLYHKIL